MLSRFGLGTAQFGMKYGRFNRAGIPTLENSKLILKRASELGLSYVDTAHLYGESESVLGGCGDILSQFSIDTKTPRFTNGTIIKQDAILLRNAFENSLKNLRQNSLDGLLIHHAPNLLENGGEILYQEMANLKEAGLVKRIGVSAYDGEIVERIHEKFPLDFAQLPINLLDRRLIKNGSLSRLSSLGIKIHARSAFLQGLLLADPESIPPHFHSAKEKLRAFHSKAKLAGTKPAHAALHYLLRFNEIENIIVGVESLNQFNDLFAEFPKVIDMDFDEFEVNDIEILNPVLWVN